MPVLPLSQSTARPAVRSGSAELPASRTSRTGEQVASTGRRIAGLFSDVAADKSRSEKRRADKIDDKAERESERLRLKAERVSDAEIQRLRLKKERRADAEAARIERADTDRETASFQGFAVEQKRLQKQFMAENDDYETYQENWDGRIKAIEDAAGKIKNERAKAAVMDWLAKNKPVWQLEIDNIIHAGKGDRAAAEGQENILNITTGDYVAEGKALKATSKAAFEKGKKPSEDFGNRPDGTPKGPGHLGTLKLKGGGVATEYSVGVQLEANGGKETDIPSLVPTLTKAEIDLMVNDIIPNQKAVPDAITQKAVDHANKRVKEGLSPFVEKEDDGFDARTDAEWEDTAKMNRIRQIVDQNVDTNIWTHEEGLKFETAAAAAIAAGRRKENEMAVEALIIKMGAEEGWEATIDALGDPNFLQKLAAGAGLTIGDAAEFTRDMKTLASSRKQAEDDAVKAVHRENEIMLEKMTRENDPALVPSKVAELFANNQIDKTTRDSYLARLNKRHPVETVREVKYQITEAIRNYKAGDATYEDTEKLLKENLASLSDKDLTTLQNSLYSAQEAVNKGTDDKAVARRVKVGADYLTSVFKAVGFLGDEDKAGIVPETYEWARFYGERMDQWDQFWELNPEATADQADAFANLLTEDVWSNNRNRYLDKPEYEAVDRRIKSELIKLGLQGQEQEAVLDVKQITINDEPADYFEFLENVATIDDPDEAKAYYKKWDKGTWPKPTPK